MQYTVEKLGKADSVTEFDSEFESLSLQLENIKMATQKILIQVQALVQPNPGEKKRMCSDIQDFEHRHSINSSTM